MEIFVIWNSPRPSDVWDSLSDAQSCSPAKISYLSTKEEIFQRHWPQDPHDLPCSSWPNLPCQQDVHPPWNHKSIFPSSYSRSCDFGVSAYGKHGSHLCEWIGHPWISLWMPKLETLGVRLVHCNDYYTVIGINITRNRISCNGITITIHQFGDNTWIEPWICIP